MVLPILTHLPPVKVFAFPLKVPFLQWPGAAYIYDRDVVVRTGAVNLVTVFAQSIRTDKT